MTKEQIAALRGAFVSLKNTANSDRCAAEDCCRESERFLKRARRNDLMAEACKLAFLKVGGDPEVADNWWSWTYEPSEQSKEK
jgi:hypothetical protein